MADTGAHMVRITDNGKIRNWVSFALEFLFLEASVLCTNEDRAIVFHTLPAPTAEGARGPGDAPRRLSKATTAVPRLLSVVEIVKREFLKSLEAKRSPRLAGLHQYNEIGCVETAVDEDRAAEIRRALSGSNHVKIQRTPYMKVTLSLKTLPELAESGATYQPPTLRKLSKSAKQRMKKRKRAVEARHVQ
ncbi:hypothetical protein C0993_006061 [Termitomyces sp. T159_Od127]|nr:hypothetical protein C0993_006061 [Termitomyces sp. T159_Od127]